VALREIFQTNPLLDFNTNAMLPVRWKIFRLVNYLQLISTLAMLGMFGYTYLSFSRGEGMGYFLLFCLAFILVIVNNCFNVHIMHRYYPDKSLSPGKETLLVLLVIFYGLITIGMLFVTIYGISEMTTPGYTSNQYDWIVLFIVIFETLGGIYIFIMQVMLPGLLKRNNRQQVEQLLEDLGKPE
jgi:hypothetical protein